MLLDNRTSRRTQPLKDLKEGGAGTCYSNLRLKMTNSEIRMTKEMRMPNVDRPQGLAGTHWSFLSHYGLGIRHSAQVTARPASRVGAAAQPWSEKSCLSQQGSSPRSLSICRSFSTG